MIGSLDARSLLSAKRILADMDDENKFSKTIISITDLDIKESKRLLKKANGEVKTAILMHLKNKNYNEAKKILLNKNGSLRNSLKENNE